MLSFVTIVELGKEVVTMFRRLRELIKSSAEPEKPEPAQADNTLQEEPQQAFNPMLHRLNLENAQNEKFKHIWQQMAQELSPVELRELALDMNVDIENLPDTNDKLVFLNFLNYLKRRSLIPQMLDILESRWPKVDWGKEGILQAMEELEQFRPPARPITWPTTTNLGQGLDWHELLGRHFSLDELAELARKLDIDFKALDGNTRAAKINSLFEWVMKAGKMDELTAYVAQVRPFLASEKTSPAPPTKQTQQYSQKLESLSLDELQAICHKLGIDFDNLPGESKSGKARELLVYLGRKNRLAELGPLLAEMEEDAGETAVYHAIRTLIFQVFPDDVALTDFCHQHLPQAVYEFGFGMSYRQKTQALLEYCTLKKRFTPLLAALEATFPEAYAANGPYEP
ncbi:MAG: hypothetical protein IPM39_23105 [Chloroflexi bacterium]|nr:hypothetical protein [Chloroflexota bacterium]